MSEENNGNYVGTLMDDTKANIQLFNNGQQQQPQPQQPWNNEETTESQEDMNYNHNNNSQDGSDNQNNNSADMDDNNNSQNDIKSKRNNPNLEPEQFRKVFIGGLSYKTDDDTLKNYFLKYGELVDYVVMKDGQSGRSRGFGFVTYSDSSMVDELMKSRPHIIDGRQVEPKRATPREDSGKPEVQMTVKKLFIGGLKDNINEEDLKSYFGQYGIVTEAVVMREKETNKARGFGFISFDDYDPVDKIILEKNHQVNGINIHVQKALPKDYEKNPNNKGGQGGGNRNNFSNDNFNFQPSNNFNNFNSGGGGSGGGGFRNFEGGMGMPNNFNDNGFGNSSLTSTYGSYNQAPGQPKMNMGGGGGNRMGGNNMNNKMGGGPGPMRRGGGFSNRSSGPYGGGGGGGGFSNNGGGNFGNNNRGRGGGGRGGGMGGNRGRGGGGMRRGGNNNGMNNPMNQMNNA